jgi:hypothetical protein
MAAVLSLCPALVAAQSTSHAFTDRPTFHDALADRGVSPIVVNLMAPSVAPTDIGVAGVSTTGGCIAAPGLMTVGSARWIDFDNGACGTGTLTFAIERDNVSAFGFFLHPLSIPGGPVTFNVTTTFNGAVTGRTAVSYHLGNGTGDGYFGLLLDPDPMSGAKGLTTITVSTRSMAHIALRDLEYAPAAVTTPEPATLTLVGAGLLTLAAAVRRRRAS